MCFSCSCTSPLKPYWSDSQLVVGATSSSALGDDGPEQLVGNPGAECFLGAHRHPPDADALPVDLRAVGEESGRGHRCRHLRASRIPCPALRCRRDHALHQQDTEPVAGQYGRFVEHGGPGRAGPMQQDHPSTVRWRHVPRGEAHAVIGGERHGLVGQSAARRGRADPSGRGTFVAATAGPTTKATTATSRMEPTMAPILDGATRGWRRRCRRCRARRGTAAAQANAPLHRQGGVRRQAQSVVLPPTDCEPSATMRIWRRTPVEKVNQCFPCRTDCAVAPAPSWT